GNTNLVTGTSLLVKIITSPYQFPKQIGFCHVDIEEDGSFTCEHQLKEDFFIKQNERPLLVEVNLDNAVSHHKEELIDIYGENGENLKGPLVYQKEIPKERQ